MVGFILKLKNILNVDEKVLFLLNKENASLNSMNDNHIIGDLLDLATVISPKLCKSWYQLANWCYKWGKKSADKIQLSSNSVGNEDQLNVLFELLPTHTTSEEKEFITSLFSRGLNTINIPEILTVKFNDPIMSASCQEQTKSNAFSLEETSQLLASNCKSLSEENIENLLDTWSKIVSRVFYFHRTACKSYFTYLKLSDQVCFIFI
jgi:hypothetical protein